MKIVINIPDEMYNTFRKGDWSITYDGKKIHDIVMNGTPLPKGHGDLIYRDDLLADSYCIDDWSGNEVNIVDVKTVKMADAVIEADGGE